MMKCISKKSYFYLSFTVLMDSARDQRSKHMTVTWLWYDKCGILRLLIIL